MAPQPLGNVLDGIDGPRGPDVLYRVCVPKSWLDSGGVLTVTLPRNLACAVCEGGGCDACGRAGAVSLREKNDPAETVTVPLEQRHAVDASDLCLRLSARGGLANDPALPRGNLLLFIRQDETPSAGIELEPPSAPPARVADAALIRRAAGFAVALCVLFYLMLRLSGWL